MPHVLALPPPARQAIGQTIFANNSETDLASGQDFVDDMAMNIRQTSIDSVMTNGQSFVVDPHQMKNRGMDVVNLCRIFSIQWFVPPLVGFTMSNPPADTSSAQPICKDIGIMVTALAALSTGHASELRGPQHQGIVKHPPLFQIL
jgi:hypothetical protein